jgi:8-oxo-dGTP pyrophosphatase MutT (NUDIX family)
MYKVFFNDRKLFLTDDFTRHFQVNYGLFYKFQNVEDLKELIQFYSRLTRIDSLYIFHKNIEELREAFRNCFINIDAAGGLVRNPKGEFLMIHRRGRWDLPKGKLAKKENFEAAAIREVGEECGISDLKLIRPLLSTYHTYDLKNGMALKKTVWFEMIYQGEKPPFPQATEDITEIRWVDAAKLEIYLQKCFPAIRDVFTYFGV